MCFNVLRCRVGYEDIKNPNKQLRAKLVIAYRDLILMLNVILYFTVLHRQGAEELAALSLGRCFFLLSHAAFRFS